VDISDRARLLSKLASLPEVRQDMVDSAKAKIAAGSYDNNEEYLNGAIDNMVKDLDVEA
jgi:hypothetical protein